MQTAEVVIIGGGIFGANLAYALATRGMRDIILLEQDGIASGSSGKATGGLRQQFADELDIRFSLEGLAFYARFIEEYTPPTRPFVHRAFTGMAICFSAILRKAGRRCKNTRNSRDSWACQRNC